MKTREFDLNIEKVLENWSVAHAIREVIANALDEQILTNSSDIEIFSDNEGVWHIRDYGRGIKYIHLTQNENEEKILHPKLIGKFGVGLKDALATFNRHNIFIDIYSKYGHITIGKTVKHGFDDITTLHAYIDEYTDSDFVGTDFCIKGCTIDDINEAKNLFLKFSNLTLLETTEYGEIYENRNGMSEIFINGIKVAEEEKFLFSYNITSLNASLKKALNRERTNVGRSAYSDRVKSILLNISSKEVIKRLTSNLTEMSSGKQCVEMQWVDVQTRMIKLLHADDEVVFVTPDELEQSTGAVVEIIKQSGKTPVFVPQTVKSKIENEVDENGNLISTISTVVKSYNDSFEFEFIDYNELNRDEKKLFDMIPNVISLVKSDFPPEQVFISLKMKQNENDTIEVLGAYENDTKQIILNRKVLSNREDFLGTLIHELTHADFLCSDVSRYFELKLTQRLGMLASIILK